MSRIYNNEFCKEFNRAASLFIDAAEESFSFMRQGKAYQECASYKDKEAASEQHSRALRDKFYAAGYSEDQWMYNVRRCIFSQASLYFKEKGFRNIKFNEPLWLKP